MFIFGHKAKATTRTNYAMIFSLSGTSSAPIRFAPNGRIPQFEYFISEFEVARPMATPIAPAIRSKAPTVDFHVFEKIHFEDVNFVHLILVVKIIMVI